MKNFDPELIIISAGFDSCRGDPLGGLDCTQNSKKYFITAFSFIIERLKVLNRFKLLVALEGGYNLESTSLCCEAVLRVP